MKRFILLLIFCITVSISFAQKDSTIKQLQKKIQDAKSISTKLDVINELATEYFLVNPKACQETVDKGIELAEESRDREMMIKAKRLAANLYLQNVALKENATKATDFANDALVMCKKEPGLINENVYCNLLMARLNRLTKNYITAEKYSQEAIIGSDEINNDSLRVISRITLGNTQLEAGNKLDAFKTYIAAQTIAEKSKQPNSNKLLAIVYRYLSTFYSSIEEYDKSIDYLYKTLDFAIKQKNESEMLFALYSIGNNYINAKKYDNAKIIYEKLITQADSLKNEDYKISGQIGIINTMISGPEKVKAIEYLRTHPEVKASFEKVNLGYQIDFGTAQAFTLLKQYDSAKYYFNKTLPVFEKQGASFSLPNVYFQYSKFLYESGKTDEAINYLKKSITINDSLKNTSANKDFYEALDSCYQKKGDYKNAFFYSSLFQKAKEELDEKGKSKDILAAEIDAENKHKERVEKAEEEETNRRHNWQYMAIIVSIITLFILLAGLGFFSVPIKWVRALGFISFIFLFEFIILIADNWIHHFTHGEPWKVLGIKVVLISVLLPLHHYLEEKVIHYIIHKKQNKT